MLQPGLSLRQRSRVGDLHDVANVAAFSCNTATGWLEAIKRSQTSQSFLVTRTQGGDTYMVSQMSQPFLATRINFGRNKMTWCPERCNLYNSDPVWGHTWCRKCRSLFLQQSTRLHGAMKKAVTNVAAFPYERDSGWDPHTWCHKY